ncbi:Clp protease N-terminal domain-containing protein [Tsukamurella sp. 8F]|uniref:Clp protease N-terminal domain-containing protein n=1 Tax=unclassified Tsukamurella TaxID=2633480 RepID=UPI0023B9413D|nr:MULTISPECIES: Clp protease N-terminal domain-containing protein [unclassified Tsukamurella]MDF0530181.1 Clp protease N-terminal domain-containing protein [Tsukamurella sp. 8J]MDF0586498.1 Clp protease N-terminal domain-containing protein [Tsukamurella sp. 8F]
MFERFTREARTAVVLAQEEARDAGADRITPTHLLISVLGQLPSDVQDVLTDGGLTVDGVRAAAQDRVLTEADAEALKGIGIDLAAVVDAVSERFGFDVRRPIRKRFRTGHIPFSSASKKTLELALREAIHRKDRRVGSEHVLLGILRSDDDAVLAAIGAAMPVDEVRSRVNDLLGGRAA